MKYFTDIMKREDWEQVRSIYLEGISTGNSTFESNAPDWERWNSSHLPDHRLVVRESNRILAWAALSPVSTRSVYSGVAELSLYVAAEHKDKGVGSALLEAVILSTENAGLWTLQGVIFPENTASLSLAKKIWFQRGRKTEENR